ncbi:MAG: BolA family transcriptional regulator [Alphaproteobacteria bacterium]|nr:BolA family transcriptional regulator [Alphaproteobacteria bacterium]MCB9931290.1 BolA family transcriptional regulator [Alphaproteobacteria bacterium]
MRIAQIERLIREALAPDSVSVTDLSHLHKGHAGDRPYGQSHYHAVITAAAFAGQNRVARQRLVFAALGTMVGNEVHALSLDLRAPGETR